MAKANLVFSLIVVAACQTRKRVRYGEGESLIKNLFLVRSSPLRLHTTNHASSGLVSGRRLATN